MYESRLSISDIVPNFHTSKIDQDELEEIIRGAINKEYPSRSIDGLDYTEQGVSVILDDGQKVFIDIDWNEIILS